MWENSLNPDPVQLRRWLMYSIPTFRLNGPGQAITTGTTPTQVDLTSSSADRWGGLSSNTWVVPEGHGGHYCFSAEGIQFDSNSTGDRYISIRRVTSATTVGELLVPASGIGIHELSVAAFMIPVKAGDDFEVKIYQDSGSTLNITSRARFMGYLVGGQGRQ